MIMCILIEHGKLIERTSTYQPKSLGYYDLKQLKPCFDKRCLKLLIQRKEAKMQWLQDPGKINRNNLSNVRCEASRHFRTKTGNI
jgi:hypothetical protein